MKETTALQRNVQYSGDTDTIARMILLLPLPTTASQGRARVGVLLCARRKGGLARVLRKPPFGLLTQPPPAHLPLPLPARVAQHQGARGQRARVRHYTGG